MSVVTTAGVPLSDWCGGGPPGSKPKCRGCKWSLCQHDCHDKKPKGSR